MPVATEILDVAADAGEGDRQARAATQGVLRAESAGPVSTGHRADVIASSRGTGPVLDRLLADERERK